MTVRSPAANAAFERRVRAVFDRHYDRVAQRTDRMFAYLMLGTWVAAIGLSIWFSPSAWAGKNAVLHAHVYAAIFLGGAITALPVALAFLQPGRVSTRHVIACGQVLWSALLIHLSGGRIETHFHVFGSLAILAFYRDWKVLVLPTALVAIDHFVRGLFWPESVYGIVTPEWWRFLEHAGWVVFIDVFLFMNCAQSHRDLWEISRSEVEKEDSREQLVRVERLAAIGQLAASVGHELRNPLAAIRNAHSYVEKKVARAPAADPKVVQLLDIMHRELDAAGKIITNLLEFSRPRDPVRTLVPLRPLVQESISIVPERADVTVVNEVPDDLPVPEIDKDQMRQVFVNLVQNAVEAIPAERSGRVVVRARGGGAESWIVEVADDGAGIDDEALEKIFHPLFSTKVKGTGLGLAVVTAMVERHGATLSVESRVGTGTTFTLALPANTRADAAAAE